MCKKHASKNIQPFYKMILADFAHLAIIQHPGKAKQAYLMGSSLKYFFKLPMISEEKETMSLDQLFDCGYEKDLIPNKVLKLLAQCANYSKNLTIADCSVVNERLHYQRLLYVSDYHALQLHLCKLHHDTFIAGHLCNQPNTSYKNSR